jgi:hypothetical protein
MRLAKIRLHAPSPSQRLSILTDAAYELNIDMAGVVMARPRNGGRALLYSDFAEAETLEEYTRDEAPVDKTTLVEIFRDTEPMPPPRSEMVTLSEREIEETIGPFTVEDSPMVLVVDDAPPVKPEPIPPVITSDTYKFVGNQTKPAKKNKHPNKR